MSDDALRHRYGEELLAGQAEWGALAADCRLDQIVEICRRHEDRCDRLLAICAEMQRRGIYDPNADYTWAVKQKWREEEAARETDYGI